MRCPYCGRANLDTARYCVSCGRDISSQKPPNQRAVTQTPPTPQRPPTQMPQRPPYQPTRPVQQSIRPVQQPRATQPTPPQQVTPPKAPPVTKQWSSTTVPDISIQVTPAPEPPAPFPPKTIAQLQALEQGSLPYTLINDTAGHGKKRIVRISYQRCAPWQQVATLLKAFKEYDEQKFDTIVLQGVLEKETDVYQYTNGQLVFDRNVRLGSQTINRYQIETGNGYASDSVRIVLSD